MLSRSRSAKTRRPTTPNHVANSSGCLRQAKTCPDSSVRAHESSRELHREVQRSEGRFSAFTSDFTVEIAEGDEEVTGVEMPRVFESEISAFTPREVAANSRAERRMIGDRRVGMTVNNVCSVFVIWLHYVLYPM